jgi:hypothetical protein
MTYSYNLGNRVYSSGKTSLLQSGNKAEVTQYGKVVEVILDDTKEVLDKQGVKLPIGAITYISVLVDQTEGTTIESALPLQGVFKTLPLPNEIVTLHPTPVPSTQNDSSKKTMYYGQVVNLWGSPNHNALPGPGYNPEEVLGPGVKELTDINPLFPFPGDTLIEGRQGQSIRIGGNKSQQNPLVDDSNNGKPYVLISNGQIKTDNGVDHIVEDIDKDFNSIYFVSDHKINLTAANSKRDSYDVVPRKSNEYIGNQVLLNGGRLFFNAKEDSIFLSAKESVGINARTLNLDATEYFCVDSKKIYLGKKARTSLGSEPVVMGTQLQNWLETLLDTLENVGTAMSTATAVSGGPVTQLITTGPELRAVARALKAQMKQFQSKKVFTE